MREACLNKVFNYLYLQIFRPQRMSSSWSRKDLQNRAGLGNSNLLNSNSIGISKLVILEVKTEPYVEIKLLLNELEHDIDWNARMMFVFSTEANA